MVLFRYMNHCILYWLYCSARCWMSQDMNHVETSCIFYVKVVMFDQLEQTKMCVSNVTEMGIAMLTVHHYLILSLFYITSQRFLETKITRGLFRRRIFCLYLTKMRFWWSLTCIDLCKQICNIGLTDCKSLDGWESLQCVAIHQWIHLE